MSIPSASLSVIGEVAVSLCLLLSLTPSYLSAAQKPVPDQQALVSQLTNPDWLRRRDAATRILAISAADRSPILMDAVIDEISRLQTLRDLGVAEVPKGADSEAAWEYYADLVDVACDSTDPRAIPVLANTLDMGHPVIDALARFGAPAVPSMLAALANHPRPEFDEAAMYSFRLLVHAHPDLPANLRMGISAVARQHLTGRQISVEVGRAIDLAAVLKDHETTRMLQAIASAKTARDSGLDLVDSVGTKRDPFVALRQQAVAALSSMKR